MSHHGSIIKYRRQGESEVYIWIMKEEFKVKYSDNIPCTVHGVIILGGGPHTFRSGEIIWHRNFLPASSHSFLVITQSNNNNPGVGILKQTMITPMWYYNYMVIGIENTTAKIHFKIR